MNKIALAAVTFVGLAAWPIAAGASGDYGCSARWTLAGSAYDCVGTAILSPRNDTRVNLALLLRDGGAASAPGKLAYPAWSWDNAEYGHVFVDWDVLQGAFWPEAKSSSTREADEAEYVGSRCQTLASGAADFRAALAAAKSVLPEERSVLLAARDLVKPACDGDKGPAAWPSVTGRMGRAWLGYLQGARAFYADDFAAARASFVGLTQAKDPWLAETARYMVARNELAAAQVGAFDEWGGFLRDKVDRPSGERARAALDDYLSAYPKGRYALSASGLTRRAAWLLGARARLARTYSGLLAHPAKTPEMLEEVESKLFFGLGMEDDAQAPLLLATWDLLRMREADPDAYSEPVKTVALTQQDLAGQAKVFARQPDLYAFLQASLAYHSEKDDRRVLTLIPDDARAQRFTPLAFSRQMLRGLALERLKDTNAAAFFQQVAAGSQDLYQRPAVQLALAMHWERSGELAKVFAPSSIVTEPELRTILMAHVAGPDLLRRKAGAQGVGSIEGAVAQFTLLSKGLSRGRYAEFGTDLTRVPAAAPTNGMVGDGWSAGWMDPSRDQAPPVGLFARGKFQESYACPALARTAATLAANPRDVKAQLCLAEFWRLNDFDGYLGGSTHPKADELGGTADLFPGKMTPRSALYAAVLGDRAAAPDDTAYALYRSIQCYAPSRYNSCGGQDVPEAQRKAWFQRLKRDYAGSKWAAELKYYW